MRITSTYATKSMGMFHSTDQNLFLGSTSSQWLDALIMLCIGWSLGKLISWMGSTLLLRLTSRTKNDLDDDLIHTLRRPLVSLVTLLSVVASYQRLNTPDTLDRWMERFFHVSIALVMTWALVRVVDTLLGGLLRSRVERGDDRNSTQLIPAVRSSIKVLIWGLGLVVALNNAGYDVGALLAGIGIGGLALAMAAKDTLANIFGGVTVFADKPFRVGDRIRLNGYDGTVEEVGLRSTRIRTLEGPMVIVPNTKFTDTILENVSLEPSRRVRHELGLVYDTPKEKMQEAITILVALVKEHGDDLEAEYAAYFNAFKESSLNIVFTYHIRNGRELFNVQTRVHLDLLTRFRNAGLEFAYPTQVQISGDAKHE